MALKTEDVSVNGAGVSIHHPLDPLTAGEITAVTRILQDHFQWGEDLRVETIDIAEPDKESVRRYVPESAPVRVARFHVYRRGVMGVWDGLVDLGSAKVVSAVFKEDARPMIAVKEILLIEETIKADARFQAALRRRGLLVSWKICASIPGPWATSISPSNTGDGSCTASYGCGYSRWTTSMPIRWRVYTPSSM